MRHISSFFSIFRGLNNFCLINFEVSERSHHKNRRFFLVFQMQEKAAVLKQVLNRDWFHRSVSEPIHFFLNYVWERWKKQTDKCAQKIFFGRTEEKVAQNLIKFLGRHWVLDHLTPSNSDCRFFGFVRKEGVITSWRNAKYTN